MTFLSFLRSHALFIAVVLLFLACWCAVAAFMGAVWLLILLTAVLVIFGAAAYICIGYCIFKRRMKKIERLKREMDELYLLGEMLPRPINSLEEVYFSVMKTVSRAAVDRVYALRRELDEYLDYVEAWVHEIKTPLTSGWLILSGRRRLKKAQSAAQKGGQSRRVLTLLRPHKNARNGCLGEQVFSVRSCRRGGKERDGASHRL